MSIGTGIGDSAAPLARPVRPRSSWLSLALLAPVLLLGCATGQLLPAQPANLDDLKTQVRAYYSSGAYESDVAAVDAAAQSYVEKRAGEVARPALVLDIDETSLSNWPEMAANDFGYIVDGPCDRLPQGPCGFRAWTLSARAEAIAPTLTLFKQARARGVAVFFITSRGEDERAATEKNLRQAGYDGWAGLILQPADDKRSVADFKAGERAKIEARQHYVIIANVGDQPSDLAGGHAERSFLLPDPFYRIP